ncbi:hypothetical protein GCM10011358_06560 [Sinisalibacter lacisalsi]|uniref:Uncharacterized protein n=1 Tax=Sinisalibacter lacisalsi TaxID=1526570 RepID=A0ABQ1QGZ5_9RHOB|nr:hypothetical protein GCM10011358_06560 [Sinisalibacter lacisalsi]
MMKMFATSVPTPPPAAAAAVGALSGKGTSATAGAVTGSARCGAGVALAAARGGAGALSGEGGRTGDFGGAALGGDGRVAFAGSGMTTAAFCPCGAPHTVQKLAPGSSFDPQAAQKTASASIALSLCTYINTQPSPVTLIEIQAVLFTKGAGRRWK